MGQTNQIEYKAGYKYQLNSTYTIQTTIYGCEIDTKYLTLHSGLLTIIDGYCWDGPSGPTIDTLTFMRGSLVHDALYQLMREQLLPHSCKLVADKLLREICLEDGMSRLRAWYVYHSVRLLADASTNPKNRKKLMTAPKRISF